MSKRIEAGAHWTKYGHDFVYGLINISNIIHFLI